MQFFGVLISEDVAMWAEIFLDPQWFEGTGL